MSRPDPIAVPAPPPADLGAAAKALIEGQIAMLTRLAEVGMGIAQDAGRRSAALAEGASADAPDPALAYARAARAVRMTLALQARLLNQLLDLDKQGRQATAARASVRRARAHRLIEQAIEDTEGDEDEAERLSSDAWERLVDADDAGLADASVGEIVARICRDLGLTPQQSAAVLACEDTGLLDRLDQPDTHPAAQHWRGSPAPAPRAPSSA